MLPLLLLLLATRDIFPSDFTPSPCAVAASCISFPDSSMKSAGFQFLGLHRDDVLTAEAHTVCDKVFPRDKSASDADQCKAWIEVYLMGVDQNAINTWKTAQACTKAQPPAVHTKPLDVWMSPESIPYDYKGMVTFYSLDSETHVPVLARVLLQNQVIYAPANPSGESATYYPFPAPFAFKYIRVPNQ